VVLVLGDVGRSPRMQYHALSLARADPALRVSLAGYAGEACAPELYAQPNLEFLTFAPRATRPLPVKVVVQFVQLLWLLLVSAGRVDLVLLQNPPTYGWFGSAGWTMQVLIGSWTQNPDVRGRVDVLPPQGGQVRRRLAQPRLQHPRAVARRAPPARQGECSVGLAAAWIKVLILTLTSECLQVATWTERVFGRKADANFCVTRVMQRWLRDTWQIEATVLHDKPPPFFRPTPVKTQHELFARVADQLDHCRDVSTSRWTRSSLRLYSH
jgi:beta-1,4-mannosyltransferase